MIQKDKLITYTYLLSQPEDDLTFDVTKGVDDSTPIHSQMSDHLVEAGAVSSHEGGTAMKPG